MNIADSKVFCMMPWVHTHFWPSGDAFPCCMSSSDQPIGNTNQNTIAEIWNSSLMRGLRSSMRDDIASTTCQRCYDLESAGVKTLRQQSLEDYAHHHATVESTLADGTVPVVNLAYLDVRFSNICNLRCRTCSHDLSSSWYDDTVSTVPGYDKNKILNINHTGDFWNQLEPYLDQTEEVYFAGGESLITDEHYRILDHWIATGRTAVRLRYTTNFTQLDYKQRNLFDLWRKFGDVRVSASLDASGSRGEYLRKNQDWSQVVANRRRMMQELPHGYFELTPTVSLMNVLHLPDFHREWIDLGLVHRDCIRINLLTHPAHNSVNVLPLHLKDAARSKILDHTAWLAQQGTTQSVLESWHSIITLMDSSDKSELIPSFVQRQTQLDQLRQESLVHVFPELAAIDQTHSSDTWCALPWVNLNTTPQGQVKLCCNITYQKHMITQRVDGIDIPMDWSRDDLDSVWNGAYMRNTRDNMLSGRPNGACTVCYKQEALGNTSPRQHANAEHIELRAADLKNTAVFPTSFELRTSTRCNLQCKTCWSGSSNLIAEQQQRSLKWNSLPADDPHYMKLPLWLRDVLIKEDQSHAASADFNYVRQRNSIDNFKLMAPGLQRLYITGGEPTMDANLHLYLQELIAAGNTSCHVSFTTNCTLWNTKLMSRLAKFDNTEVQLSVDGHGSVNDLIRQGSAWHEVTANIARYLSDPGTRTIKIYTVISALNALHLEPLLEWVINTVNLHGRKVIWFPIILESPGHQQVTVLPLASRLAAADRLDAKFNAADWPEIDCIYRNGLAHTLRAIRDTALPVEGDGLFKLLQQLNYQDAVRNRLVGNATLPWYTILPNLHATIDAQLDAQFDHETIGLSITAKKLLYSQWKLAATTKEYGYE